MVSRNDTMPLCYAPMVTPPVDLELLGHPGVELGILAAWTVELNFTGIQLNQFCRKSWGWSKFATHEKYQCTSTSWKVKLWKEVVPERWRYKDIERHITIHYNIKVLSRLSPFVAASITACCLIFITRALASATGIPNISNLYVQWIIMNPRVDFL